MRILRGELKIASIWLNFKIRPEVAGWPMTQDWSGTNFKGPRSLSNQFGRFFDQKFEIGHLGRTLKVTTVDTYSKVTTLVTLSVRPKCPISNFRSKNRPNWSERLLGPLKFVPDRSRVIGHSPATSGWILKLSHIEVIFHLPLRICIDLNCPFFPLYFSFCA